jgi:hypothetical protein
MVSYSAFGGGRPNIEVGQFFNEEDWNRYAKVNE